METQKIKPSAEENFEKFLEARKQVESYCWRAKKSREKYRSKQGYRATTTEVKAIAKICKLRDNIHKKEPGGSGPIVKIINEDYIKD